MDQYKLSRLLKRIYVTTAILLGIWSLTPGQQGQSPLAGKTIHLKNPFGASEPLINLSGLGHSMQLEQDNWYHFSFDSIGEKLQPWMEGFGIRTSDWKWLSPMGIVASETEFSPTVFGDGDEIWIWVDLNDSSTTVPKISARPPTTVPVLASRKGWRPLKFSEGRDFIFAANGIRLHVLSKPSDRAILTWKQGF